MEQRFDRRKALARARYGVQEAMATRDRILVHTVHCIEETEKSINLLHERLTEWYGLYFPELKVVEPDVYCQVVLMLDRDEVQEASLKHLLGDAQTVRVAQLAKQSIGIKLPAEDLGRIRSLAEQILAMYAFKESLQLYQEKLAQELCPNISHIAGPAVAAKLVAQAGGLDRLARFPASTIQVLGAEKALFKHLRKGSKPPKHGTIFQHPQISTSPKKIRGKIARALAGKICIASKADSISKRFIAEGLKASFDKRVADIRKNEVKE